MCRVEQNKHLVDKKSKTHAVVHNLVERGLLSSHKNRTILREKKWSEMKKWAYSVASTVVHEFIGKIQES